MRRPKQYQQTLNSIIHSARLHRYSAVQGSSHLLHLKNETPFVSQTLPHETFSEWISHGEHPDVCISLHCFFLHIVSLNALFVTHNWLCFNMQPFVERQNSALKTNWHLHFSVFGFCSHKEQLRNCTQCEFIIGLIVFFPLLCNSIEREAELHQNYLQTSPHESLFSSSLAWGFLVCIQGPVRHVWSLQYKCQ